MAFLRDIEKLIQFKIQSTDRRKDPTARPAAGKPQQHRRGQQNRNHHGKRARSRPSACTEEHGHNGHGKATATAIIRNDVQTTAKPANGAASPP